MFKLKNKIRMFDIMPAVMGENIEAEKLDLKEPKNVDNPKSPKTLMFGDETSKHQTSGLDELMSEIIDIDPKEMAHEQLAVMLDQMEEPLVELASIGAIVGKPQEDFYHRVINQIREPMGGNVATLASNYKNLQNTKPPQKPDNILKLNFHNENQLQKEVKPRGIIAEEIVTFYQNPVKPITMGTIVTPAVKSRPLNFHTASKKRKTGFWLLAILFVGFISYGFTLKNEIVREGASAFINLEEAGDNFKEFNFTKAADNFNRSYDGFVQAGQTMNFMGAGLAGIFSDLPGIGKIKSAKDLTEAGKLIAQSGKEMSEALGALSKTGSILNPGDKDKTKPSRLIGQIKDALILSNKNFQKAKVLLASIDESVIPEDKKQALADFKDKLPLLEEYLGHAVEYTDFLEGIIGIDKSKKYLLLFNNYSELRPTGGFPGTYGVVSFSGGGLHDFFVNDVYNLDGQLKRNVIPPKQLQHITPTWGMRDSSWFIDFPASAKKAMAFFSEEAGYKVDGVIALNPDIVLGILRVIGPVAMPEYNLILTADNFLETIQEEVEYGPNRIQPKQIVTDFGPKFLEKLYSADSEKWMKIFNVLMAGLEEKDIIFYFNDNGLENFTVEEGFGGEVKNVSGDYLMVNLTNVKGSKTDIVTDSSIEIDNRFENGRVIHKVILTRVHKGGDHEHGFYNRQNPAYVRVLVPEDAELLSISGNDLPNFKPLINYSFQSDFEKDRDLVLFESGFYFDKEHGVDKFEESGKKGIGFWMITNPKTTKKIEFEYSVPISGGEYSFYFQKQPGLDWKNLALKFNGDEVGEIIPAMNKIGNLYLFDEKLSKDFEVKLKLK